jgi:hypothetical protein
VSQPALLNSAVEALDAAGVAYMVTGSIVSSLQGEPRATHDVDIVIELPPTDFHGFLAHFEALHLFVDEPAAEAALRERRLFNMLDTRTGDKIDFWPLTDDPFDASRFSRRVLATALGLSFWVSAPEDTILMKLRWSRASGDSPKQYADALRVYEVQSEVLDRAYMAAWAQHLGVSDLLERIEGEAELV